MNDGVENTKIGKSLGCVIVISALRTIPNLIEKQRNKCNAIECEDKEETKK